MRNLLAHVPAAHNEMVAATVRLILAERTPTAARSRLHEVVGMLERRFPKVAQLLVEAEIDVTPYAAFPRPHHKKIASINPLERVQKEIKRRSNVVGIFPDDAAVIRLVGAVLVEIHDDWQTTDRRYLAEGSLRRIDQPSPKEVTTDEQHELQAA